MMFAIITPALITGAIADRMKFSAWFWFLGLWALVVYTPVAHWVFSPAGWLFRRGALDFAGGTVVHINAGIAALVAVLVIGRRRGWPQHPTPPHSLPLTLLGTGILWFGWFGFNAGSALAANGIAAQAFVNTTHGGGGRDARLAAVRAHPGRARHHARRGVGRGRRPRRDHAVRRLRRAAWRRSTSGSSPARSASSRCSVKFKFGYDDALDVVGVHLVGGLVGSLLLGLFADRGVQPRGRAPGRVRQRRSWELMGDQLDRGRRHARLVGRAHVRDPQGAAPRDPRRAARLGGGRGDRSRPHPALRGGVLRSTGSDHEPAQSRAARHDGSSR